MPKLGDGMPYLGGYGLIATARVGRPSFPGILFAFPCESAIPTPVEQEQGIVYHNRTRHGIRQLCPTRSPTILLYSLMGLEDAPMYLPWLGRITLAKRASRQNWNAHGVGPL